MSVHARGSRAGKRCASVPASARSSLAASVREQPSSHGRCTAPLAMPLASQCRLPCLPLASVSSSSSPARQAASTVFLRLTTPLSQHPSRQKQQPAPPATPPSFLLPPLPPAFHRWPAPPTHPIPLLTLQRPLLRPSFLRQHPVPCARARCRQRPSALPYCNCRPRSASRAGRSITGGGADRERRRAGRHHQSCRGDQVPFRSTTPFGSSTPACHCTSFGAAGCRCCAPVDSRPRMLTSGAAGPSVHFSQQLLQEGSTSVGRETRGSGAGVATSSEGSACRLRRGHSCCSTSSQSRTVVLPLHGTCLVHCRHCHLSSHLLHLVRVLTLWSASEHRARNTFRARTKQRRCRAGGRWGCLSRGGREGGAGGQEGSAQLSGGRWRSARCA